MNRKKVIRINENQLRKIVKESVKKVLNEVRDNTTYNINSIDGFDSFGKNVNGFIKVCKNGKWNFIDISNKCNFLSKIWFDYADDFLGNGYAMVMFDNDETGTNFSDYYLRYDGMLCDYNTKKPIEDVSNKGFN